VETVLKCFPLTAGFKIKEGAPAMAGLTIPLKYSGTGIHTLKYFEYSSASGGLKFEPDVPPRGGRQKRLF